MSELDDIFKEAAHAERATFKPEYWDQYAEQFSGEEKKKRGIFGFFLGEILFVSCIALLAYNNSFVSDNNEIETSVVSLETNQNSENSSQINEENNSLAFVSEKNETEDENSNTDKNPVTKTVNTSSANASNSTVSSNSNRTNITNVSNVSAPRSSNGFNSASSISSSSINTTPVNASQPTNNSLINTANPVSGSLIANDITVANENEIVSTNTKENKGEEILNKKDTDSQPENELANAEEETKQDKPEDNVAKPNKKASVVTKSKMKKLQFNLQFGGIAYNDFNLTNDVKDIRTSLFAGLEVEYMLKPNLTLSMGVNGYNRKSDGLFIDNNFQDKGFGLVNTKTTYSYSDLYFVEVPVNLNYVISSKHKIGLGPTFTRLLTTKVNVNEETKNVKTNESSSATSNEYLYHYNTFELNNVGLNVNYQFMFNRVGVNVGYTHGLNEFLNQNTFSTSRRNSLNKLNLSIKYRL